MAVLLASAASAPGARVVGKVVRTNGKAIPGALVTVTPADISAPVTVVTDADGEFQVTDLTPGSHQVQAEFEGYRPQAAAVALSTQGQTAPASLVLNTARTSDEIDILLAVDAFGSIASPLFTLSERQSYLTLFGAFPFDGLVLNDALDPELQGVGVRLTYGGIESAADIYYGSPNQLAFLVGPDVTAGEDVSVRVCLDDLCSNEYALNLSGHRPFVAAISGNGLGDGAIQSSSFDLVTPSSPLSDRGVAWVNGTPELGSSATLYLNGLPQETSYYGPSGVPGLTQMNWQRSADAPVGHVLGFVEETHSDGSRSVSQPFRTYIDDGGGFTSDFYHAALTRRVYSAQGLNLARANLAQIRRIDLGESGEVISDALLFGFGLSTTNENAQTYSLVTPGNFDAAVLPAGYVPPRVRIAAEGEVDVQIENYTDFTVSSDVSPGLQQLFSDSDDRTFEGEIDIGFSGTIAGAPATFSLQATYDRPVAAIQKLDEFDYSTALRYAQEFPESALTKVRDAAALASGRDDLLFQVGVEINYGGLGSTRIAFAATPDQLAQEGVLDDAARQFRLYMDQWSQDAPASTTLSWGFSKGTIFEAIEGALEAQEVRIDQSWFLTY